MHFFFWDHFFSSYFNDFRFSLQNISSPFQLHIARLKSLVAIIIIICGSIWTFKKEQPDLFWISKNHSKSGFELSVQNWALDSGYKLKGIAIFTLPKVTRYLCSFPPHSLGVWRRKALVRCIWTACPVPCRSIGWRWGARQTLSRGQPPGRRCWSKRPKLASQPHPGCRICPWKI